MKHWYRITLLFLSTTLPAAAFSDGWSGFLGSSLNVDLDRYVTDRALDGLFLKLGEQEALIRSDPAARTTELLKTVFGNGG